MPGGEGAGAEHPWDTVWAQSVGEALDYVRADSSPRIWTTDGVGEPPKVWAHLGGAAVRVDPYHSAFESVGWVDGWETSQKPYDMATAVARVVSPLALRRAGIRVARVVAHFGDPHTSRFLDIAEAWNEAGAPEHERPSYESRLISDRSEMVLRRAVDGLLAPEDARESESLIAAWFAFNSQLSGHVFNHARVAMALCDDTEEVDGTVRLRVDESQAARCDAMFADALRRAITLDTVVEALIARKQKNREYRPKSIAIGETPDRLVEHRVQPSRAGRR